MRNTQQTNTNKTRIGHLFSTAKLIMLLLCPFIALADSSGNRPVISPPMPFDFPDEGLLRPYRSPVCAENMVRSETGVINNQNGGTPWYYYTCTFRNNGWCSLDTGHCQEQVCHPNTDWIGPWNNQPIRETQFGTFYTCVSIGTPYPF